MVVKHTVEASLLALSSVDQDRASIKNGVGFNARDTGFGNSLARQLAAGKDLSPKQYGTAYRMLKTYQVQLKDFGIDYDLIPPPDGNAPKEAPRYVDFSGGLFYVYFPYDERAREALKANVPGRIWDADAKAWTVPEESAVQLGKWALDFRVSVREAALDVMTKKVKKKDEPKFNDTWRLSWATDSDIEIPLPKGLELYGFQKADIQYALENLQPGKGILFGDEMGLGKLLADSEPVLTPSGWRRMDALKVGDEVIGSNGEPTAITGVFPQGEQTIVKVTFSDGSWSRASWNHLWAVQHVRNGWRHPEEWKVMETRDIASTLRDGAGNLSWRIPMVKPIPVFGLTRTWLLDPYLLGLLLGDGSFRGNTPSFSSADEYLVKEVEARLPFGTTVQYKSKYDYRLVGSGRPHANPLTQILRHLDLMGLGSHNKFVPEIYLYGDKNDRFALLRGLMDTDGTAGVDGMNEYSTVSPRLADDVEFLVQSLGGTARRAAKKNGAYRVYVKLTECPFLLPRKAGTWVRPTKYPPARIISNIEEDGTESARCIRVVAEDGLFVTRSFIVTHNTPQSALVLKLREAYPAIVAMPRVVWLKWAKELQTWTPGLRIAMLGGRVISPKTRLVAKRFDAEVVRLGDDLPEADVYLIKYSVLEKWTEPLGRKVTNSKYKKNYHVQGPLKTLKVKSVILDEIHYLKDEGAKRTKAALAICNTLKPDVRIGLSGTPIPNRHLELLTVLQMLNRLKDVAKDEWDYMNMFCNANGWGVKGDFGHFEFDGSPNGKLLNKLLRSRGIMAQHEKLDHKIEGMLIPGVENQLPAIIPNYVPADLKNQARYDAVHSDLITKRREYALALKRLKAGVAGKYPKEQQNILYATVKKLENQLGVLTNEARKVCGEEKVAFDIEWIQDWLDSSTSNRKLIVFGYHRLVNEALRDHFSCPLIYGGQDEGVRQEAEDTFQDDSSVRLIVCQIEAAGVGINLTAGTDIVFVELPYVPKDLSQAIGRAWGRLNDMHGVEVSYLMYFSPDPEDPSIEERIAADVLQPKQEVHNKAISGV